MRTIIIISCVIAFFVICSCSNGRHTGLCMTGWQSDSVCPWGVPIRKHKNKCFAMPDAVLDSKRQLDYAVYGTRCSLSTRGSGYSYKGCPCIHQTQFPYFLSFRRYPQFVESCHLNCSGVGEWRINGDTVSINYKFIVMGDSVRAITTEQSRWFGDCYLLKNNYLLSINKFKPDSLHYAYIAMLDSLKVTHPDHSHAIDSLKEDSMKDHILEGTEYYQIYGEKNWWKLPQP